MRVNFVLFYHNHIFSIFFSQHFKNKHNNDYHILIPRWMFVLDRPGYATGICGGTGWVIRDDITCNKIREMTAAPTTEQPTATGITTFSEEFCYLFKSFT